MAATQVLLGLYAKLRKAINSFFVSVSLSAWYNSALTELGFHKIWRLKFFRRKNMKIQDSVKSDKSKVYFT